MKFNFYKKMKLFTLILLSCSIIFSACFNDSSNSSQSNQPTSITNSKAAGTSLPARVDDGVMLHCFDWSFKGIINALPEIAAAGYNSIQVSPITPCASGSEWYWPYQPTYFKVGGNKYGSEQDFKDLCRIAEQDHGIKIIVDAVLQHVAGKNDGTISHEVDPNIRNNSYFFHWKGPVENHGNRWSTTQQNVGMPDLSTQNWDLQNIHLRFLNECVDAGADGFRFDTAKHIETNRNDDAGKDWAGDWWDRVYRNIKNFDSLYMVGEVLPHAGGDNVDAYLHYLDIGASTYGNMLRGAASSRNVSGLLTIVFSGSKTLNNDQVLCYAENHDNRYSDQDGRTMGWNDYTERILANALMIPRAGIVPRLLDRNDDDMWKDKNISACNHFRNAAQGTGEYIHFTNNNQAMVIQRGGVGLAIINVGDGGFDLNINTNQQGVSAVKDGTYQNKGTANSTITVSGGRATGHVPGRSVVVIYDGDPIVNKWYISGTANGWENENALELTSIGDNKYQIKQTYEANGRFKIRRSNQNWDETYPEGSGNDKYVTEGAGEYTITFDATSKDIDVKKGSIEDKWYISGTANGWENENALELTSIGNNKYQIKQTYEANGRFKIRRSNQNWDETYPEGSGNDKYVTEGAGEYTITFDAISKDIDVKKGSVEDKWYFSGTPNGWTAEEMTCTGTNTYEITKYFNADGQFKVRPSNANWEGCVPAGDNWKIWQGAGSYKVIFNSSTKDLNAVKQ